MSAVVRELEASGSSLAQFAQAAGLSRQTLQRWRRVCGEDRAQFVEVGMSFPMSGSGLGSIPACESRAGCYAVEFGGVRIEVAEGFEEQSLRSLLRALREEVAGC